MTKYNAIKAFLKNKDGEWISPYTADTLKKNQITNCLLEVPQNIKLELNNGVLTLKAGSKVIVPNGFEADGVTKRFDEVVIESDLSLNPASLGSQTRALFIKTTNNAMHLGVLSYCKSGTTPVTGYYYHTGENKMYVDTVLTEGLSFPLMYGEWVKDEGYASIDQVFNGMGYIGSTIWVDKGVKALFPWGRNTDGTLNNIEGSTQVVKTYTAPSNYTNPSAQLVIDSINGIKPNTTGIACNGYIEVEEIPTSKLTNVIWILHTPSNRVYQWSATTSKYELKNAGLVAVVDVSITAGVITSFQPKLPFRAVDYNDYRTEVDSKVSKSGDTMTDALYINTQNTNAPLILLSGNIDKTQAPETNTGIQLCMRDKNNQLVGLLEQWNSTTGEKRMTMRALSSISGTEKTAQIAVGIDKDNNIFTEAPTPTTGDNSRKIATTAYCVNMRCTTKATTTSSASVTRPCWIVQNYVNGTSWYRVWSDGWIEQGGLVNGGSNSDNVTLLKSYANTNYSVMTSLKHTATEAAYAIIVSNVTTTGFTLFTYSGGAKNCAKRWYACGY